MANRVTSSLASAKSFAGAPFSGAETDEAFADTCRHRAQHQSMPRPDIIDSVRDLEQFLAAGKAQPARSDLDLVVHSASMRRVVEQARRVAPSKATVLIEGETGTGKELIARLIHYESTRSRGPFVRVNCAALTESLIESELFGHEKGAFTGAVENRVGRFECAHRGTILFDELGEMTPRLQAKLLRVLEEEEFERVGSTRTIKVDVRVLATTNRDLDEEVARGNFRSDLLYRLNVVRIRLAPLRERREDIIPLAKYFVSRFASESGNRVADIAEDAIAALNDYHWPGNVRQLRNAIHHACLLCDGPTISAEDLPELPARRPIYAESDFVGRSLEEIERYVIIRTLEMCRGNKTAAAGILGITARTLFNKLKRYRQTGGIWSAQITGE